MPRQPPTYLTAKELAAWWRLSKSTVYALAQSGHLTYYQIGGAIRFLLADVEAYQSLHRSAPARATRLGGG